MKNTLIVLMATLLFSSCSDDSSTLDTGDLSNVNIEYLPANKPNSVINERVFELINLDYPGFEKVKFHYDNGNHYYALFELLNYYRGRTEVINPNVNLLNPTIYSLDQSIADQALDYRFYVRNFKEATEGGTDIYYSFKKGQAIDWEFVPSDVTDQEFKSQKHRLQWMLPQAKAYRASLDEKYVTSLINVYSDWLKTYPYTEESKNTVQWNALQPAERLIDQLDIFALTMQSKNFTPEWLSQFLVAFSDHVEAVKSNYYQVEGSNIYVSQIQAVLLAGILMPEFKNASEWFDDGMTRNSEQVVSQFLPDGVQNELDPSYHIGVVSGFYKVYKTAEANNKLSLFPDNYITLMHNAARFLMDIIFPNYTLDNFNDTRSSSFTKNVILKNLKQYVEMFPNDEELKWISTEGKMGKKPTYLTKAYENGGFYMLRNGWDKASTMLILKNNYNVNNKWHTQPDNGTFAIYKDGRNFFPDAGVYSYGGTSSSNADRNKFAQSINHNTLTKNGQNFKSGFMNGEFVKLETTGNTDMLITENKSYADLTHRRTVFFVNKEFFVLVDEGFGSAANCNVDLNFHLSPNVEDVLFDDMKDQFVFGAHTKYNDGNNILVRTFSENQTGYAVKTRVTPISFKLQEISGNRNSYQISTKKESADSAVRYVTVILPFKNETEVSAMDIQAKFVDTPQSGTPNSVAVEVRINNEKYDLSYSL